jgi:antitoxin component YwqK of YwqJK toxin-antitoxin module
MRKLESLSVYIIALLLFLSSCGGSTGQKDNILDLSELASPQSGDAKDGLITTKKGGKVKTEVTYKEGIKEGPSKIYYDNSDQVMLEMTYKAGLREGESTKYYQNGKVYAVTPYKADKVDGIRKLYYRNGEIKAEVPYKANMVGVGTMGYTTSGEPVESPKITYDNVVMGSAPAYLFSAEGCRRATFYVGELIDGKYFSEDVQYVTALPADGDTRAVKVKDDLPANFTIICDCYSQGGYPYILTRTITK